MSAQPDGEEVLDVVVICTGNQFRSPILEGLLKAGAAGLPMRVSSAGTADLGPAPALPEAIALAAGFGVDLGEHRARFIRSQDLSRADLVIGFEIAHLAEAVVEAGAAPERTFMLREVVDLLEELPGEPSGTVADARAALLHANALRPANSMPSPDHQIGDPVGGTPDVFRATATTLRQLAQRLVQGLFGSAGSH
jgi:protein-tyrosine phosphatase